MFFFICSFYSHSYFSVFFFFNDTATTEIYTLSLHDALPIYDPRLGGLHEPGALHGRRLPFEQAQPRPRMAVVDRVRSEEHTSELQSHSDLVCRLLLEKKKKKKKKIQTKNRRTK